MWTLAWGWILLALPLPWLVRRLVPGDALDRDAALKVPMAAEFADLAGLRGPALRKEWRLAALWSVWLLALLAAARPQFVGDPIALPMTGRDLLLSVDLSGSMEEQDFQLQGQWVDRLTATKAVVKDLPAVAPLLKGDSKVEEIIKEVVLQVVQQTVEEPAEDAR